MSLPFYEPFHNFHSLLGGFSHPSRIMLEATVATILRPKMDLHEDADQNVVTVTFELPGVKKEDVNIEVHDGHLTVSGESKVSQEKEEDGYAVRERKPGKFSRTLRLPQGVKEEEISASMENGLLTVTFPKAAHDTKPRKISIV
ncbi:HSP20-like chaperone [Desarmillaria tabescens]|uniref:HSP20-like chaperone n=1 Tax=Armillaria tabescens TaxID=1929756 RepID=A0AA39NRI4_ARMTA|nr:HSP20-like chaperone [Desarmillaria tabescens]KAK0470284.1 HSP20-like chaperone [Desarmillaria tabescens]